MLAMEAAIERDLQRASATVAASAAARPRSDMRLVTGAIAGPRVAAELHRVSPVLAVRARSRTRAARRWCRWSAWDRRPWPSERGAVRSALEIRASHERQLREIAGAADVLGANAERVESIPIERNVLVRVADQPTEPVSLERM